MTEMNIEHTEGNSIEFGSYHLSWLAYIAPTFWHSIFGFGAYLLIGLHPALPFMLCPLVLLHYVYRILVINSIKLTLDEKGVWVSGGILPWASGGSGVRWRDLEDASFRQGFWGWLFKSYLIRIGHRFTKESEIVMPHVKNGANAAVQINNLHGQYLNESPITER
ncbi:hypothetical protein [Alcanivorax sp.]|uniref:hypothetical protein n=1 Tax=Alcanivorax sp. TaxID=1872427 RepID=UPI0032D9A9C1